MSPCRTILAMYALSLAFGCMLGLVIANRMLMALDDEHSRARKALSRDMKAESDWLIRDTAGSATIVFERDGGVMIWSVN